MKIYRIEHKISRCGPFNGSATRAYDDNHKCHEDHSSYDPPGPWGLGEQGTELSQVFKARDHSTYYFGFRSKAQLKRWFRSAAGRRAMAKEGFVVGLYEAPREVVAKGNWQVAFQRLNASLIRDLDVVTLN